MWSHNLQTDLTSRRKNSAALQHQQNDSLNDASFLCLQWQGGISTTTARTCRSSSRRVTACRTSCRVTSCASCSGRCSATTGLLSTAAANTTPSTPPRSSTDSEDVTPLWGEAVFCRNKRLNTNAHAYFSPRMQLKAKTPVVVIVVVVFVVVWTGPHPKHTFAWMTRHLGVRLFLSQQDTCVLDVLVSSLGVKSETTRPPSLSLLFLLTPHHSKHTLSWMTGQPRRW